MTTLFDSPRPRVFNIEAGRPFLPALARGVLGAVDRSNPFALADVRIYMPTRRAARALTDAFSDASAAGGAALLPRILTLGDLDDPESGAEGGDVEGAGEAALELDLPPAMSAGERLMALAGLVARKEAAFAGQENWPAALAAARELAALLESLYTEEIPFAALKDAAPAEHAAHWERSLAFLRIVTEAWPAHLAERGLSDPAELRAGLISALAERWRKTPPAAPTIIAGTTGSAPAVARLVAAVARAPKGAVVLPGLDAGLDGRGWRSVDDGHPQAGLKALLDRLDISPADVLRWPDGENDGADDRAQAPRRRLLSVALRPAAATDDWRALAGELKTDGVAERALNGFDLIEAPREDAEATAIAMRLRDAIEAPDATAMLVTPDRDLARRVAGKMRRWGIDIDDSAGAPLAATQAGTYLRLAAEFTSHADDPARFLALLDHPLCAPDGLSRAALRLIDRALRGPAPIDGAGAFGAMRARLEDKLNPKPGRKTLDPDEYENACAVLRKIEALTDDWPTRAPLGDYLTAHADAAERLAGAGAADRLWSGEDGVVGARLIADLLETLSGDDAVIDAGSYPAAFLALAAGATVRARGRTHPRLAILGPLEARLQHADVIVLGGLNEGVWPGDAGADPFLSRAMRRAIGLPSPERRIGLAAHDFAQLAAAKTVTLTRSLRSGDGPTTPSRWLVRLKNLIDGVDASETPSGPLAAAFDASARYADWSEALDALDAPPAKLAPPAPRPPKDARPRKISATRIEKWLRDPYAIYASAILDLQKFDDPATAFGARELGSLMHKVFELAGRRDAPANAAAMRADFDALAPAYGCGGADAALWGHAVDRAIARFAEYDAARRARGRPAVIEGRGETHLPGVSPPFAVYGVADRIDLQADGGAYIVDYKSSRPGAEKERGVFNPQLEALALIAREGGFKDIGPAQIAGFEFFVFLKKDSGVFGRSAEDASALSERIEGAARRLKELIEAFDNPETPYLSQPRPKFKDPFGDYDVLARRREWADSGAGEETGGGDA